MKLNSINWTSEMYLKKSLLLFTITLTFVNCTSKKNIVGTYRSNFADLGFFITTLKLNSDSTFQYNFRGDLISNQAKGFYTVDKNKLVLRYKLTPLDKEEIRSLQAIGVKVTDSLKKETSYPHVFYIGKEKLFGSWQDGKIVKRAKAYHKTKKYLFFGSHYYKKKWYLRKVKA